MRARQHPAIVFRDRLSGRLDLGPAGTLPGATPGRIAVLLVLSHYADADGIASPGVKALSLTTGCGESRVRAATRWGADSGLIRKAGGGYRGRAAEWQLLGPGGKALSRDHQSPEKGAQNWPERRSVGTALIEEIERDADERRRKGDPWPSLSVERTALEVTR